LAQDRQHEAPCSLAALTPRGEWPADPTVLPYFLTEDQLAHLLDRSVRTLQRRRRLGKSPPFTKNGKQILYPRDPAVAYLGAAAA
jgi:hypothetical protein